MPSNTTVEYEFKEPQVRKGNTTGKPSRIPPEEMVPFACRISFKTLADKPYDCKCGTVPYNGVQAIKFPNRECRLHWNA